MKKNLVTVNCFQCENKFEIDKSLKRHIPICDTCKKETITIKLTKGQNEVLRRLVYSDLAFCKFERRKYDLWNLQDVYKKLPKFDGY